MSEIKHTFQAGKMNKDLDERLVPQGEYRDALNIEVRTSDGSDAGTVQTLYGNKERLSWDTSNYPINPTTNWGGIPSRFVGSIADDRADKAYFFVASPQPTAEFDPKEVEAMKVYKDMIVMYDSAAKTLKPVVTDIFRVECPNRDALFSGAEQGDENVQYEHIDVSDDLGKLVRPGMVGRVYTSTGEPAEFESELEDTSSFIVREVKWIEGHYRVYFTTMAVGLLADVSTWTFEASNVLNFTNTDPYNVLITGINVIDNLLFWTDNKSEPKKINIDRCVGKVNTVGESFELHSRLKVVQPGTLDTLEYALLESLDPGLKEEHISVIRRAPRTSLRLEMSSFEDGIETDITGNIEDQDFTDNDGEPLEVGTEIDIKIVGAEYSIGKTVMLENDENPGEVLAISATVLSTQYDGSDLKHTLRISSINSGITSSDNIWTTFLEQTKPLFELTLGRFSYRYKYQDGEYSSFAPWSELTFLPGKLDYIPKKGYNLGMVNTLRYLRVTDFVTDDYQRPDDVVGVDILYKDTTSPNIRVVKSIKRNDPEWRDNSDVGGKSGVVNVSSEIMHGTLPSSQMLRAWDNVPRQAKAQEAVGNRVLYGNYLQNFNIMSPPVVNPGVVSIDHPGSGSDNWLMPVKSLKSIRKYKIGVVFGDKYGRETPVMGIGGETSSSSTIPSSVSVEKKNSISINQLQAELSWKGSPEDWMEYYKYYVKETTNEYYNLVLHRWYNAEDGNVWLAFGSADRNKVDAETYLTLKNRHGSETPILEEARYKILAIENEAPDYVKITEKVIGEALLDMSAATISDIHESMIVNLDAGDYTSYLDNTNFEGTGFVRIKAEHPTSSELAVSRWVQIAQMKDGVTPSIVTTEPFGKSAKLYNNFGLTAADAITWSVEVKDDVVENRPEFDGRFFVKVVRDGVLSANILQTTDTTTKYNTIDTFDFSSISTASFENPASTATYQGNYAGIEDPDTTLGENDRTEANWGSITNVEGIDSLDDFDDFANGCGVEEIMINFWESNKWHPDEAHNGWFIDESRVARSFAGGNNPDADDLDATAKKGIRISNDETLIDFSIVGVILPGVDDPVVPNGAQPFQEAMQTNGNLFKFTADPLDEVYRIVSSTDIVWSSNFNQRTSVGACKKCSGMGFNQSDVCYRATFTVHAVKTSDGQPLDTNIWDPRSVILHDGTESSTISIVEPAFSEGSTLDFKTGNAVWETEPKENVDLDLYYEATDALPIKLSQENIESFCPAESPIKVHRPGAVSNPVFVANDPVVNTAVRDVIGVRDFVSGDVFPFKIAENDTLKFTHADGTITEAKVVDHMYPIPSYSNDYSTYYSDPAVATYKSSQTFTLNCVLSTNPIYGCTDPLALNYNPEADIDDGSCTYPDSTPGCTNPLASNYNPDADVDDGTCMYIGDDAPTDPDGDIPPEVGSTWNSTGSNTGFDGIVVTRNEDQETGVITGFIVHKTDEVLDDGEGTLEAAYWDDWEGYFYDFESEYQGIESPPTKEIPSIEDLGIIWDNYSALQANADFTSFAGGAGNENDYWSSSTAGNSAYYWTSAPDGVGDVWDGGSNLASFANAKRVRAITRYEYTPEWSPIRSGVRDLDPLEFVLAETPNSDFNTEAFGSTWQVVSAVDTYTNAPYSLPAGTFITDIDGNSLTYISNGRLDGGHYTMTFQKVTGYYKLDSEVHGNKTTLPWFNCYSFGNGLESDRIRDDFNAPQIDNGVKVSTLLDTYREERRGSGMIYSGIYNSTSGVNNLNEFNMAEKITKDLNPSYGSIQALKTRDTNVVAFCEDKVFKVLANKDALYNADGSINLVASDKVLGNATAFAGEYGISSNPESLAVDGYRMYFTDKQRNKVLRLSMDGLTPISDVGMTSWFRESLSPTVVTQKQELIGTFDDIKGEYNLSLRHLGRGGKVNVNSADITVSFNEKSKGWSSFKSFVPETGLSINNEYLTGKVAGLWSHHDDTVNANTFYGEALEPSTIDVVFNDNPGSVKSFLAMNYEGSQAKVNKFTEEVVDEVTYSDGEYYNLSKQTGWYVESFNTDLQEAQVPDFRQKEGKWFNYISGVETTTSNIDTNEFSVQGIGIVDSATDPLLTTVSLTIRENND
jgi:hypothetical protein